MATPAYAAAANPLPLPPLRIPKTDMGLDQQPDSKVQWLQDAKLGMFIHWGVYSGPAKGEWWMHNAPITPANYQKYLTDATSEQFTADAYDPTAWAQLAKDFGAKYVTLTTRHHDGFALWPLKHPNAWSSGQAPLSRDFVKDYVAAVRAKDGANYRYRIEGSTDNATWTTLADLTATTGTSQVQVALFRAQARYVRVTVTGLPSAVWASIRSLEVYDRPFTADLGTVKLVNRNSGKVMDVKDASTADGALVIQWPWTGGTNQQWKLLPDTDGSYRLSNVKSGKVLDSPGGSAQGANLDQLTDSGSDNQDWQIVAL
ncbi:alpha-L-fucosidase [Streptomyces sp. NPDC002092]